jgi:glycosyltransferase involved in cell wall biosynthesis
MKLAFIVQRYGREIPGGAETLARQIAERLSRRHQIDVLTTTARDYVSWKNEYPESEEKLRGVRVVRFPVERERDIEEFNRFSDWIYANPHSREDELRWLEMQGPVCPKLIEYLKNEHHRYDLLVFFTYLYYPTFYGIQVAPEKSVLLPTAHDEPPLRLGIYKEVFDNANSFIFNTEAEEVLVLQRFDVHRKMRETIGIGMELLDPPDTTVFRRRYHASNRFLLYAGRIDEGKGCGELFNFFRLFREEHPEFGNLQLLLIGKKSMLIPSSRDIRYLGFLDEDEKLAAMAAANAVVIPSRLESLSIVALEAFSVGTPIIVHGGSRVLVEHCRKANAGLYYTTYEEFEGIVEAVLGDKNLGRALGRQGQQYIKDRFGWDRLLAHYELAFRSSARERRPRVTSGYRPGGFRERERSEFAPAGEPRREVAEEVQAAAEESTGLAGLSEQAEQAEQAEVEQAEQSEQAEREEAGQAETAEEAERVGPTAGLPDPEEPEGREESPTLRGDEEAIESDEPDERDLFDDQRDNFQERHASSELSDASKETEDPEDPEGGTGSRDDHV